MFRFTLLALALPEWFDSSDSGWRAAQQSQLDLKNEVIAVYLLGKLYGRTPSVGYSCGPTVVLV